MKENEISTSRVLNFPRDLVFEAWTNPQHLKEWWGPKDFTNTFHDFELKAGGKWNLTMHGPNGADYDNKLLFVEITKPIKVVVDHTTAPKFRIIANFEELSKLQTKYTFTMVFESKAEADNLRNFVAEPNEQNIDRLEAVLSKLKSL